MISHPNMCNYYHHSQNDPTEDKSILFAKLAASELLLFGDTFFLPPRSTYDNAQFNDRLYCIQDHTLWPHSQPQSISNNRLRANHPPQGIKDSNLHSHHQPHSILDNIPRPNFQPQSVSNNNNPDSIPPPKSIHDDNCRPNLHPQSIDDNLVHTLAAVPHQSAKNCPPPPTVEARSPPSPARKNPVVKRDSPNVFSFYDLYDTTSCGEDESTAVKSSETSRPVAPSTVVNGAIPPSSHVLYGAMLPVPRDRSLAPTTIVPDPCNASRDIGGHPVPNICSPSHARRCSPYRSFRQEPLYRMRAQIPNWESVRDAAFDPCLRTPNDTRSTRPRRSIERTAVMPATARTMQSPTTKPHSPAKMSPSTSSRVIGACEYGRTTPTSEMRRVARVVPKQHLALPRWLHSIGSDCRLRQAREEVDMDTTTAVPSCSTVSHGRHELEGGCARWRTSERDCSQPSSNRREKVRRNSRCVDWRASGRQSTGIRWESPKIEVRKERSAEETLDCLIRKSERLIAQVHGTLSGCEKRSTIP
eukprot:GEMP01020335.1.p1 GENE.GEMP01020335.1~~GEMP01020335.1.p1  ORF type:complete len:529 (+),score=99.14 GEMP01020335.1:192-1778(+)